MISRKLPKLSVAHHGDTAWTEINQHTGRTDLPLDSRGEDDARRLGERLRGRTFAHVFISPLVRVRLTCALAGFEAAAVVDPDLIEWGCGPWEGKRDADIRAAHPAWELFRDGYPGGESPADVAARAGRFITRVQDFGDDVLAFSSSGMIRMIAARWVGLPPTGGRIFVCRPASVGVLGFEDDRCEAPVVCLWNCLGELRE